MKPIVKLAIRTALHGIEVAYTHNGEIPAQIQQLLPDNSKELDTIIKDKVSRFSFKFNLFNRLCCCF